MEILKIVLPVLVSFLMVPPALAADAEKREFSPGEKEYREKVVKLNALETKVAELEAQFQILVEHKNSAKDKSQALAIIEQMKQVNSERNEAVEKFSQLLSDITYRYPDNGKTVMRRYAPLQKKTFEQLEKRSTLDSDLTQAKSAADRVYRPFVRQAEEEERKKIVETQGRRKENQSPDDSEKKKFQSIRIER